MGWAIILRTACDVLVRRFLHLCSRRVSVYQAFTRRCYICVKCTPCDSLHERMQAIVRRSKTVLPGCLPATSPFPRGKHDNVSLVTSCHARADAADRVHPQRFPVKYSHAPAELFSSRAERGV